MYFTIPTPLSVNVTFRVLSDPWLHDRCCTYKSPRRLRYRHSIIYIQHLHLSSRDRSSRAKPTHTQAPGLEPTCIFPRPRPDGYAQKNLILRTYLIFIEPFHAALVALVPWKRATQIHKATSIDLKSLTTSFLPYGCETVAVSRGESPHRVAHVVNRDWQIHLVGACPPLDPMLFKYYSNNLPVNRILTKWSIPGGGIDYTKPLAFGSVE